MVNVVQKRLLYKINNLLQLSLAVSKVVDEVQNEAALGRHILVLDQGAPVPLMVASHVLRHLFRVAKNMNAAVVPILLLQTPFLHKTLVRGQTKISHNFLSKINRLVVVQAFRRVKMANLLLRK